VKRKEIMEKCPEGFEDDMTDILDYFEGKFTEIEDHLDIDGIGQVNQIEYAYELAKDIRTDLY
jgi:hypothetical protein